MADLKTAIKWAEDNPIPTFGIIVIGGLAILYFMGFFNSSNSGGSNLDAAYFQATAQQDANQTAIAIAQLQTQAQENVAATEFGAAVQTNAQNNNTAQLINASNNSASEVNTNVQANEALGINLQNTNAALAEQINQQNMETLLTSQALSQGYAPTSFGAPI